MKLENDEKLVLSQRMEAQGRLAAGIAHEINTPMQYVGDNTRFLGDSFKSFLDLVSFYRSTLKSLRESGYISNELDSEISRRENKADLSFLSEEIPKAIIQTLEGVERVSKIVLAMKEFGHPSLREKAFRDINRGITNTLTISRNEWKYSADIKLDLDQNLPEVFCSIDELNQVFLNMIVNSAHAIDDKIKAGIFEKGLITIKTQQLGKYVEILISDNGSGISKDNLKKIFDPFFTTKEVGKGTGQGLAIAHDVIVNKHGGTLDVESELDRITIFTIKIPVDPSQV
ncbi:MAG: hypothetical protein HQM10_04815 [Candidatus Riflebacteria bacterium]|nr:hypothetical protein [Candidatus Riflebacteria bacterium]